MLFTVADTFEAMVSVDIQQIYYVMRKTAIQKNK